MKQPGGDNPMRARQWWWMDLLVLVGAVLAVVAVPDSRAGSTADNGANSTGRKERPDSNPDLASVLSWVCIQGRCRDADGGRALVGAWRNNEGKIGAIVYRGFACPHGSVTYHDAQGKYLTAEEGGLREPNEWNSPNDQKIKALMTGLKEVESESCERLKKAR
jgi:hypothetical protein